MDMADFINIKTIFRQLHLCSNLYLKIRNVIILMDVVRGVLHKTTQSVVFFFLVNVQYVGVGITYRETATKSQRRST